MIEVLNRQRQRKLNLDRWCEFGAQALLAIGRPQESATIVFVSDRVISALNRRFRGRNEATDVLSFPTEVAEFEGPNRLHLGDVVISVERAAAQAGAQKMPFEEEVKQLILHGLLHLCGYDHERDSGQMDALELRLRKRLGI